MKTLFLIDSLPRTGSTTLARLLNCHPDIKCLIEPFHPQFNGNFNRMVLEARNISQVVELIRHRWNGIKHVWQGADGWPFISHPEFNKALALASDRILFLERRNLLKRYVSREISRQLGFWVGTKQEFLARLEKVQLAEMDPALVRSEVMNDRMLMKARLEWFQSNNIPTLHLTYESLFGDDKSVDLQLGTVSKIVEFLGHRTVNVEEMGRSCKSLLDREMYQWSSSFVYRLIPGIERLNHEVGSEEFGRLF